MTDYRAIICGPRDNDERATARALVLSLKREHGSALLVIHGGCETGTDSHVYLACIKLGVRMEVYPADWDAHGNPAGPIRNRDMAKRGAHGCYGVMRGQDEPRRGTLNMMTEACKVHIPTHTVNTNTDSTWRIERWSP